MKGKTVALLIVTIVVYISSAYYHELAHKRIFDLYGVDSKIKFKGWYWETEGNIDDINNLSYNEFMEMYRLHMLNEMIGYNLQFATAPIIFLLLITIIELQDIQEVIEK